MLESIKLIQKRLLSGIQTHHYRYLYHEFSLDSRLTGLLGPRGVGKTTLLLQYLKNHSKELGKAIYFSADHIYFSQSSLYALIEELYLIDGIKYFFIDEVHKYKNWNQELKNIYDGFPDIKVVFSGSSSLDLIKGSYDLSRRAKLFKLPGMSFREFLNFSQDININPVSFEQLLSGEHDLAETTLSIDRIKGLFQDYLSQGYYPFSFEDPGNFNEKLLRVIEKTVHEDIASYYNLKTENLPLFKKILSFLASIPPGSVTTHNIAKNLSVNDRTITSYLQILQETGLIQMIYPYEGGNISLRKPEKIFLHNTNLYLALEKSFGKAIEVGTIRELMFIQMLLGAGKDVYYSKAGDFQVDDINFEIGGKNKKNKQIKSIEKSFLVKDELISSSKNSIPLFYFGFLY